ncbi:MAG: apolipoprotein N-acyltransferase [Kiritimatiellae bacterium]|nr:apolipoprotein N-acyltransferase [Kiritimatiellia bacterium]
MISDLLRRLLPFAWFLPGFLLWAAFPPMGEKTDVLFALAPLMWLSRRGDARESAKRWFQGGAFYWVATLSWMPAIVKNGGPWPLVALGWFALAAYCAAYFAAYGFLAAKVWGWTRGGGYGRRLFAVLVAEPVLWCGLEIVRSRLLGGFAWNQLGVVPANGGFGAPAAIGGVYLLSAAVVLVNGTVAGVAERVMRQAPRLAGVETLLSLAAVFGMYWASSFVAPPSVRGGEAGRLKVALVQRNFPCVFKGREDSPYETYGRLLQSAEALKPDLVVLPESALCEFGPADQQGALRFAGWVREKTGAALLAGGTRFSDGREYNSAALYAADGAIRVYDKVHLVPFGEFIPGDKWITPLQKLAPVGSCTPGELKTLALVPGFDGASLGVAICFEDTDSAQMRRLANMGAGLLVFITNDSWFSNSVEAEQHAWQATARAIETGLDVVRVGNNGVTGTISPDGRASWLAGPDGRPLVDRQGSMVDRVALLPALGENGGWRGYTTPYAALGDIPLFATFALLMLAMILVKYAHRHEKRRNLSM